MSFSNTTDGSPVTSSPPAPRLVQQTIPVLSLPNEMLQTIADHIDDFYDLHALASSRYAMFNILRPQYFRSATRKFYQRTPMGRVGVKWNHLAYAILYQQEENVRHILRSGYQVNSETRLYSSCIDEHKKATRTQPFWLTYRRPARYLSPDCKEEVPPFYKGVKMDYTRINYRRPLDLACYTGNINIITMLLQAGADARHGYPLSHAIGHGNIEIIAMLLENGARVNASMMDLGHKGTFWSPEWHRDVMKGPFFDPMEMATWFGHLKIIQYLFDRGYKPLTGRKHYPALLAASQGHLYVFSYLTRAIPLPQSVTDLAQDPLCVAAEAGQLEIVRHIMQRLSNPGKGLWARSPAMNNEYLIHRVVQAGQASTLEFLLRANPNTTFSKINKPQSLKLKRIRLRGGIPEEMEKRNFKKHFHTDLMETAILSKSVTTCVTLEQSGFIIKKGQRPNPQRPSYLHLAVHTGSVEMVEYVLQFGETQTWMCDDGTALDMAANREICSGDDATWRTIIVCLLQAMGSEEKDYRRHKVNELFAFASCHGRFALMRLLIDLGAEVNRIRVNNQPLLAHHILEHLEDKPCPRVLHSNTCGNAQKPEFGCCNHRIYTNQRLEIIKTLLDAGACPNIRVRDGNLLDAFLEKESRPLSFQEWRRILDLLLVYQARKSPAKCAHLADEIHVRSSIAKSRSILRPIVVQELRDRKPDEEAGRKVVTVFGGRHGNSTGALDDKNDRPSVPIERKNQRPPADQKDSTKLGGKRKRGMELEKLEIVTAKGEKCTGVMSAGYSRIMKRRRAGTIPSVRKHGLSAC